MSKEEIQAKCSQCGHIIIAKDLRPEEINGKTVFFCKYCWFERD